MTTFKMDFKQGSSNHGPPTELGDAEVTASLMDAIQNSIFKAIESMELAANSTNSNHYVTVVKSDSIAFKKELTGYLSLDPIPSRNEPSFINLIENPVNDEPPSTSESYSYEILTPVQIHWPDSSGSNMNENLDDSMVSADDTELSSDSTYVISDNSDGVEPEKNESKSVEENFVQSAQLVLMDDSSEDAIPLAPAATTSPTEKSTPVLNGVSAGSISQSVKPDKYHKCEICEKVFSQAYRLRTHISTVHLGTKPFKCEVCSRAFARKSYLIQHGQVHAEVKRYQCDLCKTAYARLADYKKHCRKPSHLEKMGKKSNTNDSDYVDNLSSDVTQEDVSVPDNHDSESVE